MTEPTVTQADRDAAAPMAVLAEMRELIRTGKADHYAELFAAHREAAERATIERVVKWLRERGNCKNPHCRPCSESTRIADAIERGEWGEMGHD